MVSGTEQLWSAGAAIGLREGHAAGVLGIVAGRAQGRCLVWVMGVTCPVLPNLIPPLACPPHVICTATIKFTYWFCADRPSSSGW